MLLKPDMSECELHQKEIVCKDKGSTSVYRAINPNGILSVRKYRLDGNLVKNEKCCDYLILDDTCKKSYYIELKGRDVEKAVCQILAGENICKKELHGYISCYRIIASKSPTHSLYSKVFRELLDKVGPSRFICKTRELTEQLA